MIYMKNLLIVFMLLNSGCAALDQMNRNTQERNAAKKAQLQKQQELQKERERTLAVGAKKSEFIQAWGAPRATEAMNDVLALSYDLDDGPFVFVFKNDVLTGWKIDYDRLNYLNQTGMLRQQENANNTAAWAAALNNMNQVQTNSTLQRIETNQRQGR